MNIEGSWIAVGENRCPLAVFHGVGRGGECQCGDDDLIVWFDSEDTERKMQRGGPVTNSDGISCAAKLGKGAFKFIKKGALRGDPRASQTFHHVACFVAGKVGSRYRNARVGPRSKPYGNQRIALCPKQLM